MATSLGVGNSQFKPVKLGLKIDLCHTPIIVEGLGKYRQGSLILLWQPV